MKEALALALSLFLAAPSPNEVTVVMLTPTEDGFTKEVVTPPQQILWERMGTRVRLGGSCAGSCIPLTGMANVCLLDGALMWFNAGDDLNVLTPGLREYVEASPVPLPTFGSGEFIGIDGADAIAQGMMRAC